MESERDWAELEQAEKIEKLMLGLNTVALLFDWLKDLPERLDQIDARLSSLDRKLSELAAKIPATESR